MIIYLGRDRLSYLNLWIGVTPPWCLDSACSFYLSIPDRISIGDYSWFLDNPDLNWTPPPTLIEWMAKAKKDGKPIVYIGFGSITVPNPNEVTQTLVKAVLKSKSNYLVIIPGHDALDRPR